MTSFGDPGAFDALAQALAEVRERLGDPPFADRRRVVSLMADRLPDSKRELRAIASAIDEGVPAALAGVERHLVGLEMDRLASRLENSIGLRIEIARPIVRAFAFALDLGPLPSVYGGTNPVPAPVVQPTGDWAGMSQPAHPAPAPVYYPAPGASQHQHWQPQQPAPPAADVIRIGNHVIPRKYAVGGSAAIVAVLAAVSFSEFDQSQVTPAPTASPLTNQQAQPKGVGGEETDFGVAAKRELEANVGSPTPLEVPGGKRATTAQVRELLGDKRTLLIDVLADNHPQTLKNAKFVPVGGTFGSLTDGNQAQFSAILGKLTAGDRNRPLVFFCAGPQCWESYNAMLRAEAAGYRNIHWYRGGLIAWQASGLDMEPTPAPAGTG